MVEKVMCQTARGWETHSFKYLQKYEQQIPSGRRHTDIYVSDFPPNMHSTEAV